MAKDLLSSPTSKKKNSALFNGVFDLNELPDGSVVCSPCKAQNLNISIPYRSGKDKTRT